MKSIHTPSPKERSSTWYYANKDKPEFTIKRLGRVKRWRRENPKRYLLQMAKARAKETGRQFSLVEDDISIPKECPALKTPFTYGTPYAASVDRVDPSKGYTKDNIQVISRKANLMKQDASKEELKNFAKWINTFQS